MGALTPSATQIPDRNKIVVKAEARRGLDVAADCARADAAYVELECHSEAKCGSESKDKPKHNRSRAGCYTCRLRRKKCDEAKPKCGPCSKHMLKCIWPRKGQGPLTKEMREKMKKKIDFYDDGSSEGVRPENKSQYFVNYTLGVQNRGLVLLSSDVQGLGSGLETFSDEQGEDDELDDYDLDRRDSTATEHRIKAIPADAQNFWQSDAALLDQTQESGSSNDEKQQQHQQEQQLVLSIENDPSEEWISHLKSPLAIPGTPTLQAFWEKLLNTDARDSIFSPGFLGLSPTTALQSVDEIAATTTRSALALANNDDDYNMYGLDEELSEKFYDKLMQKFVSWTTSNHEIKRTSVAKLMSQYQFTQQELLLYYTCIYYFLPAVGPQHTLPQLTTTETFVPLLAQHAIVKDVFLCCGATFLAWCQPQKYSDIAEQLYQTCKSLLQDELSSTRIRGDETWVFACFQLLCLTNKLHNGQGESMVDRCVDNLVHSFNIIKRKYHDIEKHGSTPTDRMLIESFMYNYTVSLLVAKDLSKLPNPFGKVFYKLTVLLKSPIFNDCDVEWMNNPVLGPSVDAFCMLAKVSFLSRMQLPLQDTEWQTTAQTLLQECLYYTPPTLPEQVRNDACKYEIYRPGLLCGSIISKACYLLLNKILRFEEFDVRDPQIQGVVKYTIQSMKDIEKGNPLLCILLWSLLVIGAFTVDAEDRLVIKEYLKSTSETIHSYGALKINLLLQLVWDRDDINLLFVRENISQVII
ncbi:LAME_0B06744g1_1 [Lachancea meyersii CBS 8951]|uniref:LAME_0B06744g1_1 n=1 Tax=Lachancea meyersii CBS 8951 TaxID=1266667 RepID=A0A1G4IWA3_9SACH|nr:LAME_0B06744g1_1 [Lachancea meyersii CBS 8951]